MIRRGVRATLLFTLFGLSASIAASPNTAVLVIGSECPIDTVSSLELRKIYFGIKVKRKDVVIRGLRNLSDKQLDRVFLQTVMAMSKKSYRRRLLSLTLQYGRPGIVEILDEKTLLDKLKQNPCSLSYLWEEKAKTIPELKILNVLWRSN